MPMAIERGQRWNCLYKWCEAWVLLNKDGSLRKHKVERGGTDCPGGGYKITGSPVVIEDEKMHERARALGLEN